MVGFVTYKSALYWAYTGGGFLYVYRAENEAAESAITAGSISETAVGGMAAYKDAVWIGSGTSGALYKYDVGGASFSTATTIGGTPTGLGAMAVYVPSGSTRYLYLGVGYSSGAQVHTWDGTTATSVVTLDLIDVAYMFVFDGKLYVAGYDAGGVGLLYSYDGANWRLVLTQAENWIQSGARFGTDYYLGSGRTTASGASTDAIWSRCSPGYAPSGSRIRAMVAVGGVLYAGAAAADSYRGLIASTTGTDWHELRPAGLKTAAQNGLGVRHLGQLNGTLYLAEELSALSGGVGALIYKLRTDAYNASGTLETVRFDAELPSVDKAWRRITVTHAPLVSGQAVAVDYRIDGATSWTSLVEQQRRRHHHEHGNVCERHVRPGDRAALHADLGWQRGRADQERAGGVRAGPGHAARVAARRAAGGHGRGAVALARRDRREQQRRPVEQRALERSRDEGHRGLRGSGWKRLSRVLRRPDGDGGEAAAPRRLADAGAREAGRGLVRQQPGGVGVSPHHFLLPGRATS